MPATCGIAPSPADAAGPFGAALDDCATPLALWASAMEFVSTLNLRIVLLTGDFGEAGASAPCSAASPAQEQVLGIMDHALASVRAAAPQSLVYPVVGNHDSAPGDVFSSTEDMAWLFDKLANGTFSASFAGDADALATIRQGGWYSTPVTPSLSIVALNTNYFAATNPALTSPTSPAHLLGLAQLSWLNATLESIAARGARAWVIGHHPPKGAWVRGAFPAYRAVLSRFPGVVAASFFGHDHVDELTIVRSCSGGSGSSAVRPRTPATLPSAAESAALPRSALAAALDDAPYAGPWKETRGIDWCSGGNLPVGDVWGQGLMSGAPHCPLVPAANGTLEGRVALCEAVCGAAEQCAGFTYYPAPPYPAAAPYGACCMRTDVSQKPANASSAAFCVEKVGSNDCAPDGDALHMLYVAPSLTEGYPASNPGLRVFSIDDASGAPTDLKTYYGDLAAANDAWAFVWALEYSARDAYGLADLSVAEWAAAFARWATNGSAQWGAYIQRQRKLFPGTDPCEGPCKDSLLAWVNGTAVDG